MVNFEFRRLNPLLRVGLVSLSWGVMTSAVLISFIFQGYFVPGFNPINRNILLLLVAYLLIFLVAFVSGMILSDFSAVLGAFISAFAVMAVIEYVVLVLPSILGTAEPIVLTAIGLPSVSDMAITIVFSSLFPVSVILGLAGSMVGAILGERILD